MSLIHLCVERPVGVAVGVLLLVLFGLLSLFALPVQLTPNVDVPVVKVTTTWTGANPQEVEREIIDRQEEQLRSVRGLRKMTSTSNDDLGEITLEFFPEVILAEALREVNDKLRQVASYPIEVNEPIVQAADAEINNTIAWLILFDEKDSDEVRELRDFAEDHIKPYLDRVPGVASVDIFGGMEREVQVRIDAARLAARGIPLSAVEEALRRQNLNVSAGARTQGKRNVAIRTVGQFASIDEVRDTVVLFAQGGPIYIRDVAEVELGYKRPATFVRSRGQYVLAFPVRREVGANVITVMNGLREAIRKVNEDVLQTRRMNLELVQVYDETTYITDAIRMVFSNLMFGSALVLGLLLVFLRSWRATAVLALSIPISVIGCFVVIVMLGRTLNVVSLAGLAFAVGDVVDSAYVVLENIFRHRQMGKPIHRAVLDGTHEVWSPVLATTLTTMAVFIPVIFITEEAGQLFRDISIAEVAAAGLSMIVAITVIPPLAARMLRGHTTSPGLSQLPSHTARADVAAGRVVRSTSEQPVAAAMSPTAVSQEAVAHQAAVVGPAVSAGDGRPGEPPPAEPAGIRRSSRAGADSPDSPEPPAARNAPPGRTPRPPRVDPVLWFAAWIARRVDQINGRPLLRIALILFMTLASFGLVLPLIPDATYLPAGNRNLVFGFLLTPPGYSLEEFREMAARIEAQLSPYWTVAEGSPEHKALDARWRAQVEAMIAANQIPELTNPGLSWLERNRARREWLTPPPLIDNFFFVIWNNNCFMGCSSRDPARVKPLVRLLQTSGQAIPGTYAIFFQSQIFAFGGGNTAEAQVRGDDLDQVVSAAGLLQMSIMEKFGFPRATPSNFSLGRPELRIRPDRERAAEVGLTAADIGFLVAACGDGAFVGEYRQLGGDSIDIGVYIQGQRGQPTSELAQVPLVTPTGRLVTLGSVALLEDTTSLEQILRIERQRAVTLEISPPEALPLEAVLREVKELAAAYRENGQIDRDVLVSFTGNADKLVAARNSLIGAWEGWNYRTLLNILGGKFLLSVLIVYLLMCALYESWLYPFVIMFSVPLAIFGGFLGLRLANVGTLLTTNQPVQQLDVLTFLGFVMLTGLVVKNAILLVEQSLVHIREHRMAVHPAIAEAVRVRVRPVLMTSLTSVFGLLPLAFVPGAGSELYRGLASVMLGGMIVSTIGTLVLVPIVLGAVLDFRRPKDLRGLEGEPSRATPAADG